MQKTQKVDDFKEFKETAVEAETLMQFQVNESKLIAESCVVEAAKWRQFCICGMARNAKWVQHIM